MEQSVKNPVELLIVRFGSLSKLARAVDKTPSVIGGWRLRGRVPTAMQSVVLDAARRKRIPLSAEELIGLEPRRSPKA